MCRRAAALALALAVLLPGGLSAQTLLAEKVFGTPSAAVTPQDTPPRDVLLLLPTVPVTFSSLEKNEEGEWRLGSAVTMGVGVTFLLGKATKTGTTLTAEPWVIAGAALNAGVQEDPESNVTEALTLSGFFGFGDVALSFSRNLLRGGTSLGLSLKVDTLTNLAPNLFMCLAGKCDG